MSDFILPDIVPSIDGNVRCANCGTLGREHFKLSYGFLDLSILFLCPTVVFRSEPGEPETGRGEGESRE
jgi:hypothetical protein